MKAEQEDTVNLNQ